MSPSGLMRRALLFCLLAALPSFAQDALGRRMLAARERVFPTLVHVTNVEEGFAAGEARKSVSTGSGFFIDATGHIVTNYHVAGSAKRLYVTLASRKKVAAQWVAGDAYTDLAVLRVDPKVAWPDSKPVTARLGDSSALKEGDFVMAMGSPLSLTRSVSFGIISCRDRALSTMRVAGHETGKYNTWLQTDAAINPGNSGGPLVNLRGEVIGVNTRANLAANNIGFAIPSDVVKEVVAALLEHGRVPRSWLGLRLQPTGMLADTMLGTNGQEGVLVAAVTPGSPAAAAGLRPGDLLLQLNGRRFTARFEEQLPDLYRRISKLPLDADATLVVRRLGRVSGVTVRPAPLERDVGRESAVRLWGVTVQGITPRMMREMGLFGTKGVILTGVRVGSPASGRLERGDVIVSVQGKEIGGLADFLKETVASIAKRDKVVRLVLRRGTVVDVTTLAPEYE